MEPTNKKWNKWKIAFFALLVVVAFLVYKTYTYQKYISLLEEHTRKITADDIQKLNDITETFKKDINALEDNNTQLVGLLKQCRGY